MADKKAEKNQECVQVVVRCRPFSTKETKENRGNIIATEAALLQIGISNPSRPDQAPKHFTFDAVYDETTQQKAFYEESCYDLVEGVMEGYNGTIFAYGQTGCGKTHTMQGYNDPPELRGVIPHSFDHMFENIKGSVNTAFLVRCCYLEIYNEEVRDLLAVTGEKKDKLELKEDPNKGVYIKDLTQAIVSDQEAINRLMDQGQKMRTVGATAMNLTSSRSHSIFTIVVEINDVDEAGKDHIRVGKLNLVDLAGSERASKTGATGDRLKEGCKINLSLSALGNVISALVDGKGKHIPYRDSKLTRLLQDSLGGNTKTLMVAAISPADYNYEETLSTLRYANRAKNIKNKPKINEDPKDAMLRQYKEEIEILKQQLATASQSVSAPTPAGDGSAFSTIGTSSGLESVRNEVGETLPSGAMPNAPRADASNAVVNPSTTGRAEDGVGQTNELGESMEEASVGKGEAMVGGDTADPAEPMLQHSVAYGGGEGGAVQGHGDSRRIEERVGTGGGEGGVVGPASPEIEIQEKIVERVVVEKKVIMQKVEVEVESKQMANHRQALENYNRAIEEQRNRLGQELETSVLRADVEKRAREEMARKLNTLQTKVIGLSSGQDQRRQRKGSATLGTGVPPQNGGVDDGGDSGSPEIEDPEVIIARKNAEHRRMQAKIRQKRRKEARLEMERVRALEEKAEVEKEMADAMGQAEEKERRLNKICKKLGRKLVEAREEIDDLAMEHEREREELLDTIRNQNKELQLWEQVARQILPSKEIARIWERGQYDENEQAWVLPRIKPRGSYVGDPYKLPLLAPPGAVSGSGIDDDANSQASGGGGSGRQDQGRGAGGRGLGGDARGGAGGVGVESGGSGGKIPVSGKKGAGDGGGGADGDEVGGRRRSVAGNRRNNEDQSPRRVMEEVMPKAGGIGREAGGMRNTGSTAGPSASPWDDVSSPNEDPYKLLTPPISPAQGRSARPGQAKTPNGVFGQGQQLPHPRSCRGRDSVDEGSEPRRRPSSRRDSGSSLAARDFTGDAEGGARSGAGQGGEFDFPSQGGGVDGGRADRCPSRQGGARSGSRATSGSRLGRESLYPQFSSSPRPGGVRSASSPEDSIPRQADYARNFVHDDGSATMDLGNSTPPIGGGGGNKTRAKSRRRKTRTSLGGREGFQQENGAAVDWGSGGGEQQQPATDGGSKRERRPRSNTKREAGNMPTGTGVEGAPSGYPSLLDSRHWDGGGEGGA